jgi:hypothetical protein
MSNRLSISAMMPTPRRAKTTRAHAIVPGDFLELVNYAIDTL